MRVRMPYRCAFAVLALTACGERPAPAADPAVAATVPAAAAGAVVEVKLVSDEKGNRFEPSAVTAHQGDILRLALVSGVHNLHFLADSNPGKTGLPEPSEMLQLPGQTLDITLGLASGTYFFQCDPHAVLGMTGHLAITQ